MRLGISIKKMDIVLLALLALVLGCAFLHLRNEDVSLADRLDVYMMWVGLPLLAVCFYFLKRRRKAVDREDTMLTTVIMLTYAGFYLHYATAGPSDPNTAGHMHIVLTPVFLGVLMSVPILRLIMKGILERPKEDRQKPEKEPSSGEVGAG